MHIAVRVMLLAALSGAEVAAQARDHNHITATTTIDSARRRVVISVGPIDIPANVPYDQHVSPPPIEVAWPVSGWVRGFRVVLVDSAGRELPREMLHHAGVVNADRRQLISPAAERLLAASRETETVRLPASLGVPMPRDSRLLLYFAAVNPTNRAVRAATLRFEIDWTPEQGAAPRDVMPLIMDAMPLLGEASTFDAPPGLSTWSREFTLPVGGHLRAMGGHLHDYGVELRLEDAETGKVLSRLSAKRTSDGRVTAVSRTRFLFKRKGLRLEANRRYRIVGVYCNTSSEAAPGAMAGLVGLFTPDDMKLWPALDATDPVYRRDYAWLLDQGGHRATHHKN
jgi:hypothetical protein